MAGVIAPHGGSQQLRIFRRAIRDGSTLEEACAATNGVISPGEGRIYVEADKKFPPPPEAFELIGPTTKESNMASAAKKEDGEGAGITGEYNRPDAEGAFKIYDNEIKAKNAHIQTIKGDLSDPHKRIKDDCHFPRKVLNFIVGLEDMEDAKRDHHMLALHEGLRVRGISLPDDLVTRAEGKDGDNVIPMGERQKAQLATLQMGVESDGTETDLAEAGEADDDFDEATDEELAAQKGRGKKPSADVDMKSAEAEAAE